MMRRCLAGSILLLFFGGLCIIGIGGVRIAWHTVAWEDGQREEIAEDICSSSDETLRITRRQSSNGRTYYNFYCDDAQGNTRNIGDELGDAAPIQDDTKLVFAGVGGMVLGIFVGVVGIGVVNRFQPLVPPK